MDITLSDNQVKQLSSTISINDVLNWIKKDFNNYAEFLNDELLNQEITKFEYEKELILIEKMKKDHRKEAL